MINWSVEEFLTGKFEENLGPHCKLEAEDGQLRREYFTKRKLRLLEMKYKLAFILL